MLIEWPSKQAEDLIERLEGQLNPDESVTDVLEDAAEFLKWLGTWRASHLHYKGGHYRVVTREVRDEARWPGGTYVLYEDEEGTLWVRTPTNFDEKVTIKPAIVTERFRPLVKDSATSAATSTTAPESTPPTQS